MLKDPFDYSEYGHLQKLIEQAIAIEDVEERNKAAKYIIQVWKFEPPSA
jgi:hypothetical protein